jgi:hypothetical protein
VSHRGKNLVARDVLFGNDGLTSATVSVIGGFLVGHAGGGRNGCNFVKGLGRGVGLEIDFMWSSHDLYLVFT